MYVCGYPTVPANKYQPLTFFSQEPAKNIKDFYLFTKSVFKFD